MQKVLVITADPAFPLPRSPLWETERVADLDAASEAMAQGEWFALVIDARDQLSVYDFLSWRRGRDTPTAVAAVLPSGDIEQARAASAVTIACIDAGWMDDEASTLRSVLRDFTAFVSRDDDLRVVRAQQEQLIHNEKFAAVGLLAAEIAHEINNPSTFVITNLTVMIDYVETIATFNEELRQLVAERGSVDAAALAELEKRHEIAFLGEDLNALLDRSLVGLRRIHQLVDDLRYFGAERRIDSGPIDVEGLVRAAINLVRHEARFRAELAVELPELPIVHSDGNRLSQVILNVLVNAVQAIPAGSVDGNRVLVSAEVSDDAIVLSVLDTGVGIAEDAIDRVFEPFFTTKAPGEGTGLGLSISRDIMRSLGGDIRATSTVGSGSRFDVVIPRNGR